MSIKNEDPTGAFKGHLDQIMTRLHDSGIGPLTDIEVAAQSLAMLEEELRLMLRGADVRFSQMSGHVQSEALTALQQVDDCGGESLTSGQRNLLYWLGTPEAVRAAERRSE